MKSVIIIGAGMGGLAAALRLRHNRASTVTVIEKQQRPGGRSNVCRKTASGWTSARRSW